MTSENSNKIPEKTNENKVLNVEPASGNEENIPVKTVENYSFRGGKAYVGHTQALKLTGSNAATLHRKTKDGTISFEKDEKGHKIYQVVELERVFGKLKVVETNDEVSNQEKSKQLETGKTDQETAHEVALLKEKLRHAEEIARLYQEQAEKWQQQAERATLMLTYKPEPTPIPEPQPAPEPKKGFLGRLFGGDK